MTEVRSRSNAGAQVHCYVN